VLAESAVEGGRGTPITAIGFGEGRIEVGVRGDCTEELAEAKDEAAAAERGKRPGGGGMGPFAVTFEGFDFQAEVVTGETGRSDGVGVDEDGAGIDEGGAGIDEGGAGTDEESVGVDKDGVGVDEEGLGAGVMEAGVGGGMVAWEGGDGDAEEVVHADTTVAVLTAAMGGTGAAALDEEGEEVAVGGVDVEGVDGIDVDGMVVEGIETAAAVGHSAGFNEGLTTSACGTVFHAGFGFSSNIVVVLATGVEGPSSASFCRGDCWNMGRTRGSPCCSAREPGGGSTVRLVTASGG